MEGNDQNSVRTKLKLLPLLITDEFPIADMVDQDQTEQTVQCDLWYKLFDKAIPPPSNPSTPRKT